MAGKLIIHAPDVHMGVCKFNIYLDKVKYTAIKRGEMVSIDIDKDCKLQVSVGQNMKSTPYSVKAHMLTELDFSFNSLTWKCTPVERRIVVLDEATEAKRLAEKKKQEEAEAWEKRERRMRCNVCGNVFCYTYSDIKESSTQSLLTSMSAVATITSALAGSRYDMYESNKNLDRQSAKNKDYSRCPHCNSKDIIEITQDAQYNSASTTQPFSNADELKKYKELLDMGVITQEEFNAKKKQLLGL